MSRPINESVELLTETLGNCKTALTEKQVADVESIKISDVDEKIAEIQAGGTTDIVALSKEILQCNQRIDKLANIEKGETFTVTISEEAYDKYLKPIATDKTLYLTGLLIRNSTNTGSIEYGEFLKFKDPEDNPSYNTYRCRVTEGRTTYVGEVQNKINSVDHLIFFIYSKNSAYYNGVIARTCDTCYV